MRQRAVPLTLTVGLGALVLAGCQTVSGPVTSEDRVVADVDAVDVRTSGDLTVVVGQELSLTVTAVKSVLPHLTSEVDDGVLVLGVDGSRGWWGDPRIEYLLTVPDEAALEALAVRGSGGVEASGLAPERLGVRVAGSGDVRLEDVDVAELRVDVDGSGSVLVDGVAGDQRVRISGSGGYEASGLTSTDATVAVEGSGDASLDVTGTLAATVAGSGSVRHTGGAAVTSVITGSGSVDAR